MIPIIYKVALKNLEFDKIKQHDIIYYKYSKYEN